MRSRKTFVLALALFAGVLSAAGDVSACPNCKGTVESSAADGTNGGVGASPSLPGGFNVSIYLMLAGLFGVMGMVAGVVIRGVRATNAGMAQGATARRGFPVTPGATAASSQHS